MSESLLRLQEGCIILLIGFSTVFIFLTVMIFAMHIQSAIVKYLNKVFPVAVPQSAPARISKSSDDEEIAVAIACAALKENHG